MDRHDVKHFAKKWSYPSLAYLMVLFNIKADLPIPSHIYAADVALKALKRTNNQNAIGAASATTFLLYVLRFIKEIRLYDLLRDIEPSAKIGKTHSLSITSPLYLSVPWIYAVAHSIDPRIQKYKKEINISMFASCILATIAVYFRFNSLDLKRSFKRVL